MASDGRAGAEAGERLALFGDVHGNLAALRAVLADIRAHGITRGACTGDLVMRGLEPEGCIDAVRALGWPCAQGNTDLKVGTRPGRPPDHPKSARAGSRVWTTNRLSDDRRRFLAELPAVARTRLGPLRVAVMHGGPDDPKELIGAGTPARRVRAIARELGADVLVNGHTHSPLARRVGDVLLVNPGSVGEGSAGDRRPSWAWLELRDGEVHAQLERVDAPLASVRAPA